MVDDPGRAVGGDGVGVGNVRTTTPPRPCYAGGADTLTDPRAYRPARSDARKSSNVAVS